MIEVTVITTWTGTGSETEPYRPRIADDYPLESWRDVTSQPSGNIPPDPNLYIIRCSCDVMTLDAIRKDGRYKILHEKTEMGAAVTLAERTELANWLAAAGTKPTEINKIGIVVGETKEQMAKRVRDWAMKLPKAAAVELGMLGAAPVAMVRVFGRDVRWCADWTWKHVGAVRWLYGRLFGGA
jgi:hypothetical protein